jgi:uncharacterized membrane protein
MGWSTSVGARLSPEEHAMTAPPVAGPAVPDHREPARRPATPAQLQWLSREVEQWRAEGLVDEPTAAAIRDRYVARHRVTLARIVLTLGAIFVGLGLIWFVASNLDQMSPLTRFLLMVAVWVGLVVAAELLARRRDRLGTVPSPVLGAVRLLAAAAYGAVVYQGAQSLQASTSGPLLVGVWAAGALVYAYAVRGLSPLVLGIGLGAFWFVWTVLDAEESMFSGATAIGVAGVAAVGVGVLHTLGRRAPDWATFGIPWREIGAGLVLLGLFVAALPPDGDRGTGALVLWVGLGVALALAVGAMAVGGRTDRLEAGLALAALAAAVGLSLWSFGGDRLEDLTAGDWARALVAVVVYLLVTSGYALIGGMRDSARLTWAATAALVIFTTVQATAVFSEILSGAALFILVGVVLLGTGILADRGRRRLVREGRESAS